MSQHPTLQHVIDARRVIAPYVHRTPLRHYPGLSELLGAEVHVKHENHQVTCAFKARGGVNLVSRLDDEARRKGVVTASTGNHAQSIAFGANTFGIPATIYMPEGSNPGKVEAARHLGAQVVFHGQDFDDARLEAERVAQESGKRYIHSANEPDLIAGVGTATLEILEDLPEVDVIFVPIGGGSGACGACIAAKAINPKIRVIGVQAEKAPAAYESWKQGQPVALDLMETAAEGLATRVGFELTQSILRELLDDFLLVSEEDIREAVGIYLEQAHTLAEGAGASCLAAALNVKDQIQGQRVVLILSGGNISPAQLAEVLRNGS
ncbi:MAG: threonine/serine dehydratase [Acidobacteriota bacterium]